MYLASLRVCLRLSCSREGSVSDLIFSYFYVDLMSRIGLLDVAFAMAGMSYIVRDGN